ncbi:hypothetical protein Q5424_14400 [Conexibacter sp. JD483]|uniref:hypothetical protein n=1 Tax=unclassified Conexibacter TaxID=2627773 RepID=UPI002715D717|nr:MULTISPECIES: hypothetical protein [unclassified Conexibacter]MDO8186302.1 hypothetical protein [Conexibacter sp. CPCC 205706]MDO8197507.1 hypothetical protein [Conexibacter sp. CPCC 205762]MDR9370290.1 hypothetical protein [Conexibacter sp. JD483]
MLPFALQAVSECPAHADLALALGAEFEPLDVDAAQAEVDALAADLLEYRRACPGDQLSGVAATVAQRFRTLSEPQRIGRDSVLDDLLLHRVLDRDAGHALPLTIVAVEAGRRVGIPLGIVGRGREQYLAHAAYADPCVADLAQPGALVDLGGREEELGWQCAHQVSALLLNRIAERSERIGHFAWALQAAELRLALPAGGEMRERMERDLQRVRARLN